MAYWIYKDTQGQWRWFLMAANGRKIANSGEGYWNKQEGQLTLQHAEPHDCLGRDREVTAPCKHPLPIPLARNVGNHHFAILRFRHQPPYAAAVERHCCIAEFVGGLPPPPSMGVQPFNQDERPTGGHLGPFAKYILSQKSYPQVKSYPIVPSPPSGRSPGGARD